MKKGCSQKSDNKNSNVDNAVIMIADKSCVHRPLVIFHPSCFHENTLLAEAETGALPPSSAGNFSGEAQVHWAYIS